MTIASANRAARLIAFAALGGLLVTHAATGGQLAPLLNVPSAAYVLFVPCLGLLVSFRPSAIVQAFGRALACGGNLSVEAAHTAVAVLDRTRNLVWAGGFTLFLLATIQVLPALYDPGHLGSAVASACLPMLYAVVLAEFVVEPLKYGLIVDNPGFVQGQGSRVAFGTIAATCVMVVVAIALGALVALGGDGIADLFH